MSKHTDFLVQVGEQGYPVSAADAKKLDVIPTAPNTYHTVSDHVGYDVEVVSTNGKEMILLVNGSKHTVLIKDSYDQLIDKMGLSAVSSAKVSSIYAPMPGLILEVLVAAGDTVAKDDPLVILEAMKMENVLKSAGDGVVKSIEVAQGDAVDKNQILIELE